MTVVNLDNITLVIAIGGALVGIYHFFRNPNIKADKSISLLKQLLEQTEKKNEGLMEMNKNHIHTSTLWTVRSKMLKKKCKKLR